MRNHLHWLFLITFGIALIGCQDDITINNPENSSNSLNKPAMGQQSSENLTTELTQIGDRIWKDLNKNGIQDAGEEGFPGITVALYTCDGNWLNIVTDTDVNGNYLFKGIEPGSYKVAMNIPDGWSLSPQNIGNDDTKDSDLNPSNTNPSFTDCFDLALDLSDLTRDGGLHPTTEFLGQVGGRIWIDLNKNGIQNSGEEGFPFVTIALYTCDGNWLNMITETDANGNYLFKNLEPGNYKVAMNIPDGWLLSPKNRGNDRKDSDFGRTEVNPSYTDCFEINGGEIDLTWDGGLYPSKKIHPKDYGYWKTHSKYGSSKYDATWALIGEDTPFFYSEQTWIEVIKINPRKSNTYYILAHQYIAARLNELSGSYVPTNIANAILKATELFENSTYTPTYIGNLRKNNPLRKEFTKLAELLEKYNRGKNYRWHHWWD